MIKVAVFGKSNVGKTTLLEKIGENFQVVKKMDGGFLCYEMSFGENKVSFYDYDSDCPPMVHPTEEMLSGYEYALHGELVKHKENFDKFILKVRRDAEWSPKFNSADGIVGYLETQRDIDYPEFLKGMVVATREIEKVAPEFFKPDTIVCYGALQFTMVTDTHAFALFSDNSTAAIGPSGVPVYARGCAARESVFAALKYAEEGQAHESTDIASAGGSYDRGADKKIDVSLFVYDTFPCPFEKGVGKSKIIRCVNKSDLIEEAGGQLDLMFVSALTGQGVENLIDAIFRVCRV
jgi:hypothetical protein